MLGLWCCHGEGRKPRCRGVEESLGSGRREVGIGGGVRRENSSSCWTRSVARMHCDAGQTDGRRLLIFAPGTVHSRGEMALKMLKRQGMVSWRVGLVVLLSQRNETVLRWSGHCTWPKYFRA